jgi:gamma-tubulin complex component 4
VWQLVVVDSQLVEHLASLKDYMLLAKGDFYQCFLTDAASLLTNPGRAEAIKDVGE